jgi:hypothetical protein
MPPHEGSPELSKAHVSGLRCESRETIHRGHKVFLRLLSVNGVRTRVTNEFANEQRRDLGNQTRHSTLSTLLHCHIFVGTHLEHNETK